VSLGGARCGTHPEIAAVDVCKRCGKFLCGECLELLGEDAYCASCATRGGAVASALAKATVWAAGGAWLSCAVPVLLARAFTFTFAVFSLLLPTSAALAAVSMGLVELRRIRRGDASERGRRWVITGFALAIALLSLMVLLIFWLAVLAFHQVLQA
jgi:hypothetical protein